jgi:Fe-Mn family superoxide dismutase
LEVHHDKHHARYVENLNRLLHDRQIGAEALEEIIRAAQANGAKALFNNAAQSWNHSFFWNSMAPKATRPGGLLAGAISSAFAGIEGFAQRFVAEGTGHFGSGWVWLVARGTELEIVSTHDAGSPIAEEGVTPLLACDVWEHAYYIDYRQNRADWLAMWCHKLANWHFAAQQYGAALGHGKAWRHPLPAPAA